MGFFGNLLVKGFSTLLGEETSEIFGGNGTDEKKELFDKLLNTWNEVFQKEEFFVQPEYTTLNEKVKLPVDAQFKFYEKNVKDEEESKKASLKEAALHTEEKITRLTSKDDKIDFVCLNRLYKLHFSNGSRYDPDSETRYPCVHTNANQVDHTFYYFRYVKNDSTLEFCYKPHIVNDSNSYLQRDTMDILELRFTSNGQTLSASVYWQPEVTADTATGSNPRLFFNKLGRNDIYKNLENFVEKLTSPLKKAAAAEEERKQAEENERKRIAGEKERSNQRQAERETWKKEAEKLLSQSSAESALDSFLSAKPTGNGTSNADKRAKLANEYYEKGLEFSENGQEQEAFNAMGIASELGNIEAKVKLGRYYQVGFGTEEDENEAFYLFFVL